MGKTKNITKKKKKKRKAKEQNGEMGCNNCFIEVAGFVVSSHHNR